MEIGFEFIAAKPKGLRAAADEPAHQPMRPREVTVSKNPSADQKRIRRQMARDHRTAAEKGDLFRHEPHPCPVCRKPCPFVSDHGDVLVYNCPMHGTFNVPRRSGSHEIAAEGSRGEPMHAEAAMNDVGDCRLCGGDLKHVGRDGGTQIAKCEDCGTRHELQGHVDDNAHRIGQVLATASTYTDRQWRHLAAIEVLAGYDWDKIDATSCPKCHKKGSKGFRGTHGSGGARVQCEHCKHEFGISNAVKDKYASLRYASMRWTPQYDTTKYAAPQMSAIARRAHAVLDTPEGTL